MTKNSNWKAHRIKSSSGAGLRLFICMAAKPKAVIQINHGMAEHAWRYQRFAQFLAARGYHSFVHDHRGHGETIAPDAPQGVFARSGGWQKVLEDVRCVNQHIHETTHGLPAICFGHSMGSTIAASYMLHHPETIDGAAIWNGSRTGLLPGLLTLLLNFERMFKGSDVPSQLASTLTFEAWNKTFKPNRTGSDWLSRDEAEVDKYIADPLCGFSCSNGMWLDLLGGLQALSDKGKIAALPRNLPVHILAGAADPCSSHGKAATQLANRLEAVGMKDITTAILPDTRHECLNELNRNETMADFADWLDARFR